MLGVLNGSCNVGKINRTLISLIPNVDCPRMNKDFRPISLCSVLYKIVSKCLAIRLMVFLDDLIFENQSTFMRGILIHDNIIIGFKGIHTMKHGKGLGIGEKWLQSSICQKLLIM